MFKEPGFYGSRTYYVPLIIPKCVFQKYVNDGMMGSLLVWKVSSSDFS